MATTMTELRKAIFFSKENPDALAGILAEVLTITPEVDANEVSFALTTPTADEDNTITGGGSVRDVEVNVENTTASVVITATNKSGQTFEADGTDKAKVTVGGSGTALNATVDTSDIKTTGGSYEFSIVVKETGKNNITYNFTVTVAEA